MNIEECDWRKEKILADHWLLFCTLRSPCFVGQRLPWIFEKKYNKPEWKISWITLFSQLSYRRIRTQSDPEMRKFKIQIKSQIV